MRLGEYMLKRNYLYGTVQREAVVGITGKVFLISDISFSEQGGKVFLNYELLRWMIAMWTNRLISIRTAVHLTLARV